MQEPGEVKTLTLALEGNDILQRKQYHTAITLTYPLITVVPYNNVDLEAGDANTVYTALIKILHQYHVPLHRVVGICSDGATTMLGRHKGVCTQLVQYIRNGREAAIAEILTRDCNRRPDSFHVNRGVFVVHCVCHRLALVRK